MYDIKKLTENYYLNFPLDQRGKQTGNSIFCINWNHKRYNKNILKVKACLFVYKSAENDISQAREAYEKEEKKKSRGLYKYLVDELKIIHA